LVATGLLITGCGGPQPYRTPERLERGLVIVLPGIEGRSGLNEAICRGLNDGGVDWAIELYDWSSGLGLLFNLRAYDRNRRLASEIGWRISQYLWDYPGRPVVLVGQSGGGAMAVWAAEQLLPGHKIEGAILLAASLSPQYILDFALGNSRQGIVSFYSPRDWLLLGVGTTVAGTMDGRHTTSAGSLGFEVPDSDLSKRAYKKLFQVGWRPKMAEAGHSGMHLTSGAEKFISQYVAPFVLKLDEDVRWSDELIEQIIGPEEGPPASAPGGRAASAAVTRPQETRPATTSPGKP